MNKLIIFLILALLVVQLTNCRSFQSISTQDIERLEEQKNSVNLKDIPPLPGFNQVICKFRGPASICQTTNEYGDPDPTRPIKTLNDLDLYQIPSNAEQLGFSVSSSGINTFNVFLQVNANRSFIRNFHAAPVDANVILNETNSKTVYDTGYYFSKKPADGMFGSFDRLNNAFSKIVTQQVTVTLTTTTLKQGGVEKWEDLQELWVMDPTDVNPYSSKIILQAANQLEL